MIDFSELNEIDIGDLSSWPIWFRWTMVGVLAAGLLFAGYKYMLEREQKKLARLEKNEQQLKQTFLTKKELVVNLPAYKEQMVGIQDRFDLVLKQLPDKTEVPALLVDISQAGLTRGLQFQQFKPDAATTDEFYMTLPISITVFGKYHQLAEFVSDLASLPRIVTLGDMTIKRQEGNILVMEAQLFTYQYLEESVAEEGKQSAKVRIQR